MSLDKEDDVAASDTESEDRRSDAHGQSVSPEDRNANSETASVKTEIEEASDGQKSNLADRRSELAGETQQQTSSNVMSDDKRDGNDALAEPRPQSIDSDGGMPSGRDSEKHKEEPQIRKNHHVQRSLASKYPFSI